LRVVHKWPIIKNNFPKQENAFALILCEKKTPEKAFFIAQNSEL
jgi:hypothetical protein